MDDGEVVELGTHSDLMKMQGLYFDMVTSQVLIFAHAFMHLYIEKLSTLL